MSNQSYPNPRQHPDNANLPTVNRPETIIGTTITFLALAVLAISFRLWVRIRDHLWGWDDLFILLAGCASIVGNCIVCQMPKDGQGLHLWTLTGANVLSFFKHVYSTNIAYCLSATSIKLSILFQYLRVFREAMPSTQDRNYRSARMVTIVLIVICTLWGTAFSLLAIFSCDPIKKNWNLSAKGKCIGWGSKEPAEFFAMFVGHSASNTMLDILVLMAPLPFLRMLRLAEKSRAGLITLFVLGCIVISVAIGRMISLSINRAGTIPVVDMTFHTPTIYILAVLEVNIAIIAASIPIFWPAIATYATNKIWVVNEIEVHVEETARESFCCNGGIGLIDQKSWHEDKKDDSGGRTSRMSVLTNPFDRAASRQEHGHRRRASNASSIGRESQRALYRTTSNESSGHGALAIVSKAEHDEWFANLERKTTGSRTTTRVERSEPYTQIKALKR